MALVLPKIVYDNGRSSFTFVYPPRIVPFRVYESVRHDLISSAGVRETIWERTDEFFEFDMEYVKLGTDVQAWDGFVQSALQGLAFDYYPDSTLPAHTTYLLEDTNWTPAYKQLGMYTFHMRWRKQRECPSGMTAPVPLEIVDLGLSSDFISAITFRRSQFRFVKSDYPAGSTFRIDVVAYNRDSSDRTAQILDSSDSVVATITVPAGTTDMTLFENVTAWTPTADDDVYRVKLPVTTGEADLVFDVIRIVASVTRGAFVSIEIPMSSAEGHTGLDQTSGGGDLARNTSTVYTSLGGAGWRFKYVAADWATISKMRFAVVFSSAVTGSTYGEVCLWDLDAAAAVSGVSVNNMADPDTSPTYKDIDFDVSLLTDGHTYEPRYRRVGSTTANVYMHKVRLAPHLTAWSKGVVPYRCGKGGTAGVSRMKMPADTAFTAGAIASRSIEAFGTTDPGHTDQGSYIADGGLFDSNHTFSNVTESFLQYTDTLPAGVYQSGDLTGDVTAGNRYSIQRTSLINVQSQMLLWFKLVRP